MNPTIWGPSTWFFLHSITINYPYNPTETEKKNVAEFFNNLYTQLPCEKCKNHYKQLLRESPIESNNGDKPTLFKWLVYIHNKVNKSLGKKIWTINEVANKYIKIYNSNSPIQVIPKKRCKWNMYIKLILLLFSLFLIIRILNSIINKWKMTKQI